MRPTRSDATSVRRSRVRIAVAVLAVAALSAAVLNALRPARAGGSPSETAAASHPSLSDYKTLPVYFEQNRGQTDPRVQFLSHGEDYTIFLTRQGTVLALRKETVSPKAHSARHKGGAGAQPDVKITTASVWINLAGAHRDTKVEGIDPLRGRINYLIGNDPAQWHTDIPTYARVRYRSVYPGIDLVYYGTPQALEYDLIAAPGADPGLIRMELEGAQKARLDRSGDLVITTAAGDLTMRKPRVYQDTASGDRIAVQAHYVMSPAAPAASKRIVTVAIAEHNPRLPLVIDPEIVYSTYLGGKGDRSGSIHGFPLPPEITDLKFSDAAIDLALGPGNTTFITGLAYSSNFPASPGAFQTTNQSSSTTPNAFVAEFDTTKSFGNSLIYSTYLGGKGCNSAVDPICTAGADGDEGDGVAVDTSGNAYVAGLTYSTNFPNLNCSWGTGNNQGAADINNGFVTELNSTGSGLVYSCYIHGSKGAPASAVAIPPGCASNCTAYVLGNTTSDAAQGVPVLNAYQTDNPDTHGNSAGYLTVVKGGGGSLKYSTFLGGTGTTTGGEALTRVTVEPDSDSTAFLTGGTFSTDFPTKNPFQSTNATTVGAENAVVAHIDPTLSGTSSLLYSTYLGGSGVSIPFVGNFGDIAAGIALDSSNNVYVAGVTGSPTNFPHSGKKPAYQTSDNSLTVNAFVTELDTTATPANQLIYSTYLGGSSDLGDGATDVTVDSSTGEIYVAGLTTSDDFPVMSTCTQLSSLNGTSDAFVTILNPNNTAPDQLIFSTFLGGSGEDAATAIARDSSNFIYVAGGTFSSDFPVTGNAYQYSNLAFAAGHTNAFVTKLDPSSSVCPTPIPSPSITVTPTPTKAVVTPTPTPTKIVVTPTPTATATPMPPEITSLSPPSPGPILVGGSFVINGNNFTNGSVVNFFVSTSGGPVKEAVLTPTLPHTSTSMTVPVEPDTLSLGQGFVAVNVVNTDISTFPTSNNAYALLQGNAADGIPSLTAVNGTSLDLSTSANPDYATNNVKTLIVQGDSVTLGGTGFDTVHGVAVNVFTATGNFGPVFVNPGPGLTSTSFSFTLPAGAPTGPGSLVVINRGTFLSSNAVSVPIGALVTITSVSQTGTGVGSTITVKGTGFSTLTVINFFNGAAAVNLGGLKPGGIPEIPLTLVNDTQFTFTVPAGAVAGASYVQVLNPPFVPYTSSGNTPNGAFTLK